MPAFKDEHVLIIAPGSQTTLAQLGLPESFTPARLRIPTRMFPSTNQGEWEPYKIREKKVPRKAVDGSATTTRPATETANANGEPSGVQKVTVSGGAGHDPSTAEKIHGEAGVEKVEVEYEEDVESDEGAVYPLKLGRVTNWSCFLALLSHIHNTLSPPFHTPILLITEPAWTAQDKETVTQFCFEKFRTPAFCLMDSALAVCYAYGTPLATVIDVGYEKCDVTAVNEFLAHDIGRAVAVEGAGGEAMTQRLLELLGPQGWNRDMCEQLKKSAICEILPKDVPLPGAAPDDPKIVNPALVDATGQNAAASGPRGSVAERGGAVSIVTTDVDGANGDGPGGGAKAVESSEGVLDVASIVASGKTAEFLARKEKEKAEKAARKAGAADAQNASAKPAKIPNSRREKNTFIYETRRVDEPVDAAEEKKAQTDGDANASAQEPKPDELTAAIEVEGADVAAAQPPPPPTTTTTTAEAEAARKQQEKAARKEERRRISEGQSGRADIVRKEIEVGIERFRAADGGILETIADAVHRTIMAVEEVSKRAELWDSMIVVGNGSKIRGFKDALISSLIAKHLISPSSATIFTSELPSQLSTPAATGANTPQLQPQESSSSSSFSRAGGGGGGGGGAPSGSHVNPLLLAATTASNPALGASLHHQGSGSISSTGGAATTALHGASHHQAAMHSSHGQTPTSIKLLKPPEYFPEWKEVGYEEAIFLGAQVAAKVVFVVDQGISKGFMTRQEYNEVGPQGIHDSSL